MDQKPISWLIANIQSPNIALDLPDDVVDRLGTDVVQGYDIDEASRADWKKLTEAGLKIAMQVIETKTSPWVGCFTLDTDVLTSTGWKPIADVKIGEKVYSRDKFGAASFCDVTAKFRLETKELIHFEGKSIDLLVTPNHKMLTESPTGTQRFNEASEFISNPMTGRRIPLTSHRVGASPERIHGIPATEYVRFLGWFISEGYSLKYKLKYTTVGGEERNYDSVGSFGISQSKGKNPEKYETIRKDIEACGFTYSENKSGFIVHARSMNQEVKDELRSLGRTAQKHIPKHILLLNKELILSLLDTLVLGDGSTQSNGHRTYYTVSSQLVDDIQEICQYAELRATVTVREPILGGKIRGKTISGTLPCYCLSINTKDTIKCSTLKRESISINAEVACVETEPHHTLYVRRNGKAVWCGNCANVKHPLIATAAIQFASRAYPEIVKGVDVVKARVVGEDPEGKKEQRAKRVSNHMSWQLTEQITEWDEDTDKLLHSLPVMGICYRKTYWDPMYQRPASEGRSALQVIVNHKTKSIDKCRRITDEVWLYKNEVIERERAGLFVEDIWKQLRGDEEEKPQELFLEQHCFADLDGDGYEEPYIITVHRESGKVARIVARYDESGIIRGTSQREVARIEPVQYFTKYGFIPAPDGSFHDLGFAQLLSPLNETINTILNQLLDAGTLHNLGGGFVGKGVKWQGGKMTFLPGEWKNVDVTGGVLKDNVVPLPTKEPSAVLFQLLGVLTDVGNRLASVSETMTGETPGQNVPATTVLAMIEQGLKVFTSIYKRVYRSLKSEYKKLYRLNRLYLDEQEYYRVLDAQSGTVFKVDYDSEDLDIVPVADPTISSEAQRLARARAQFETMQQNPSIAGRWEILHEYYEALNAPNIDKLMPPDEKEKILNPPAPPPDPAVIKLQGDILKQKHDYELASRKMDLDEMKQEADIQLIKANAIKALAEAESKEAGQQFELYKHDMETLTNYVKMQMDAHQREKENKLAEREAVVTGAEGDNAESDTGGAGGMEGASGDAGSAPVPSGDSGGLPGTNGGGPDLESLVSGANSANDLSTVGRDLRGDFDAGNQTP